MRWGTSNEASTLGPTALAVRLPALLGGFDGEGGYVSQEFVWVVDDYCDRISRKNAQQFLKDEDKKARQWAGKLPASTFLPTEHEAREYLVVRASTELVKAELQVKKARSRLKKCQRLLEA